MQSTVMAFRIVDLASQADEVARWIAGWPKEQVLAWFEQQGHVTKVVTPYDDSLYRFRSNAGIETGFRLTENGQFVIIGHHTTYQP
jgi:hypothetical protein